MARRPPQEFIQDITVANDGLPSRRSQLWTKNKLGILHAYLRRYALACRQAGAFYFVDTMAGPGLCHFPQTGEFLLGSTRIALAVNNPPFRRCLALELNRANADALRSRTQSAGDRVVVVQGDANVHLVPSLIEHIPRNAPTFVLLDPGGTELHWKTIESAARHREGPLKSELLILLGTSWLDRMMPKSGEMSAHNLIGLNRVFPSPAWQDVWERRRTNELGTEEARRAYVSIYADWLQAGLGYTFVEARSITRPQSDSSVYHLVFASDHPAGRRIMSYVFDTMHPNELTQRLPGF